ncbi:MAG: DUF3887 domain-containing protein [Drouetiella hepatica Uher 2000/2452]|jgi:hypothetical protein|uniref:DUF3887 domain-containing protein n=1 Tax=Drouetiella hepatica Uher 2000/2452 TaxID=904376 RepID=A0A951Q8V4_9CYAN|nr:DUF3887 domain-containing protein [Drouetiella hepatica Uher 2000/2452]
MPTYFSIASMLLMPFSWMALSAISASAMAASPDLLAQTPLAQTSLAQTVQLSQATPTKPMTTRAEEFVNLTAKGDFVGAWQYIHPSLRTTWSPVDMQQSWHDLQNRTGAFQQFNSFRQDDQSVVLVNTQFEKVTDNLIIIFDDTRQWIVGVDFPQE